MQRYYFSIKSARKSWKNLQIEIYLVGTGPRCDGDGFHHINSIIIYYGIRGALTWFTSDPWLNNHNYHCGSLVVMELLSIFAQNKIKSLP